MIIIEINSIYIKVIKDSSFILFPLEYLKKTLEEVLKEVEELIKNYS